MSLSRAEVTIDNNSLSLTVLMRVGHWLVPKGNKTGELVHNVKPLVFLMPSWVDALVWSSNVNDPGSRTNQRVDPHVSSCVHVLSTFSLKIIFGHI